MQTNGGGLGYPAPGDDFDHHSGMDGVDDCGGGGVPNGVSNGECVPAAAAVPTPAGGTVVEAKASTLTRSQQEVIRLIGQFLRNLGLKLAAFFVLEPYCDFIYLFI